MNYTMSVNGVGLNQIRYNNKFRTTYHAHSTGDTLLVIVVITKDFLTTITVRAYDCYLNILWEERMQGMLPPRELRSSEVMTTLWGNRVCIYESTEMVYSRADSHTPAYIQILDIETKEWARIDLVKQISSMIALKDILCILDYENNVTQYDSSLKKVSVCSVPELTSNNIVFGNKVYSAGDYRMVVFEWDGTKSSVKYSSPNGSIGILKHGERFVSIGSTSGEDVVIVNDKWNTVATFDYRCDPIRFMSIHEDVIYTVHLGGGIKRASLYDDTKDAYMGSIDSWRKVHDLFEVSGVMLVVLHGGIIQLTEPPDWNKQRHKLFSKTKRRMIIEMTLLQSSPTVNGKKNDCVMRKLVRDIVPLIYSEIALTDRIY